MRTTDCRYLARVGLAALAGTLVLLGLPGTSLAQAEAGARDAFADDSHVLLARGAGYGDARTARQVRVLQRMLRAEGWQPGPVDGLFGRRTERAVTGFQGAAGLNADGIVGPRTARALDAAGRRPLALGAGYGQPAGSPRVRALQARLRHAGLDPGPVDGVFGPRTEDAVKRLQRSGGVAATGVAGEATRRLLVKDRSDTAASKPVQARPSVGPDLPLAAAKETRPLGSIDELEQTSGGERGQVLLIGAVVAFALAGLIGLLLLARPIAQDALAAGRSRIPAVKKLRGPVKLRGLVAAHLVGSSGPPAAVWVPREEPAKPAPTASSQGLGQDAPRTATLPDGVRALGYVSVSDKESFDDPGLKAQMNAIDSLCEHRGWRLLELVRDKEVASGKALERPGLGYALDRIEAGEASCLVVARLRRLSHSVADLGRVLEAVGRNGGRLVALDLGIDTATPEGRKAANVLVAVSGWERQRLAERTRQGLEAARAKGGVVGRPSVHDVPALKKWIVELRESGLTLQAIADRLNAEGVPTLRGGEKWRPSAVQAAAGYKRPPRRSRSVASEESANGRGVE